MALDNDVKDALRENEVNTEITDLISSAKADIILCGVLKAKAVDSDPLIKRAITLYCKAHYAYEDPKLSERFESAYKLLRDHLCLSSEYTEVTT